jgi:hypothetical protein
MTITMSGHPAVPPPEGVSVSGVPIVWNRDRLFLNRAAAFRRRFVDPLSASRGLLIGLALAITLWAAIAVVTGVI